MTHVEFGLIVKDYFIKNNLLMNNDNENFFITIKKIGGYEYLWVENCFFRSDKLNMIPSFNLLRKRADHLNEVFRKLLDRETTYIALIVLKVFNPDEKTYVVKRYSHTEIEKNKDYVYEAKAQPWDNPNYNLITNKDTWNLYKLDDFKQFF